MISFDSFIAQDGVPIYLQIVKHIKSGIVSGTVVNGDEVPSRRVLSALLGVNPNTIQKAYKMLEDDGFIQSVSGRGNSQDNAPMESFFGKMKTQILDLVALSTDMETVRTMITGYLRRYNSEFYQYNLAGLTPDEFYTYVTTGIYPLDEYYGIKSTELMSVSELVAERRRIADEKNRKSREAYARKNEERNKLHKTPLQIIARDQRILRRQIWDWKQTEETAHKQIDHLNSILEKAKTAGEFISSLPQDKLDELMIPQNWQKYPELDYIFEMKELF